MLKGYDRNAAVALIYDRMNPEDYHALPWDGIPALLAQCVEADFDYMYNRGIIRKDGSDGDNFYSKEDASYFIQTALVRSRRFSAEEMKELYLLAEDYMDYHRSYLELNGMRYPEDEWSIMD